MSERTRAVANLDAAYSIYVRRRYADTLGYVSCWTCGAKKFWEKDGMQAGHFQTRTKYSTRWHLEEIDSKTETLNCMPQCAGCNMANGGRQYEFGCKLDAVYGAGTAQRLIQISNSTVKFTTVELKELTHHLKQLIKDL